MGSGNKRKRGRRPRPYNPDEWDGICSEFGYSYDGRRAYDPCDFDRDLTSDKPSPHKYYDAFSATCHLVALSHNGKRSDYLNDFSRVEDLLDLMDSFEE